MTAARKLVEPGFEYAKEHNEIVRPRRGRKKARIPATVKICFLAACCVGLALFYLQQQVTSYYLSMELEQLQEQVNALEQRNDHLLINLESQRSLQKIEQLARTQLGMVEPERVSSLVVERSTPAFYQGESRFVETPAVKDSHGVFATLAAWLNKAFPLGGVEAGTLRK